VTACIGSLQDWSAMRNFANSRHIVPHHNGQSPWAGQGFVSPPQPKRDPEEWQWVSSCCFCVISFPWCGSKEEVGLFSQANTFVITS